MKKLKELTQLKVGDWLYNSHNKHYYFVKNIDKARIVLFDPHVMILCVIPKDWEPVEFNHLSISLKMNEFSYITLSRNKHERNK